MLDTQYYTKEKLASIKIEALELLQPLQQIEKDFLEQEEFLLGLNWGIPRYGHPEGKILYHIKEVLDNIYSIPNLKEEDLKKLRIIAFVHDTFKYKEDKGRPRNWQKHHAIYAKNFLAQFTSDKVLLDLVELHDEAYYIWRRIHLQKQPDLGVLQKQRLLERLGEHLQLFYLFFKCDTQTGDKIQSPVSWFEQTMEGIEVVEF
ncbi:MAG: HD domain-containing protein [Bacteroidota bacterium]